MLVNSVPKSGTTWTRRMVASLPGYAEFPMQGVSGAEIHELESVAPGQVFHGHLVSSQALFRTLETMEFRTVYVYRDLRDVVVSDYHHRMYLNPNRAPAQFLTMTKEELLMPDALLEWCGSAKRFQDVANWIAHPGIPAIKYEDLKADGVGTMHRALTEIGFKIDRRLVGHIVESNSFERQAGRPAGEEDRAAPLRKGIVGDWRNHFTQRNIDAFKDAFGEMLIAYGYEQDLNW